MFELRLERFGAGGTNPELDAASTEHIQELIQAVICDDQIKPFELESAMCIHEGSDIAVGSEEGIAVLQSRAAREVPQ